MANSADPDQTAVSEHYSVAQAFVLIFWVFISCMIGDICPGRFQMCLDSDLVYDIILDTFGCIIPC